jgi:hypothetical protein
MALGHLVQSLTPAAQVILISWLMDTVDAPVTLDRLAGPLVAATR